VIIPIYNEQLSMVLRTAHSMLNRSPPQLIREVIFVDDVSSSEFLNRSIMDEYVAQHFNGRGKVLYLQKRVGLIQARMAGARIATGDVLLFSDAHTEAAVGWLPPLLEPIAENYRVCTVPIEDNLDAQNFNYPPPKPNQRVIFDWHLDVSRAPVLPEDQADPSKPYKTPIMSGGLFAISAKFFWELGGYDDQLEIWGGEQFEISFKVWQCGGEMYLVPCSHFGHMFRGGPRAVNSPQSYDYILRNYKRVVEVWMDEYKEYVYMRALNEYAAADAGDLTRQLAVREKLQCKPFKWFMENVAVEIVSKFPVLGPPWFAKGAVSSVH
jgi:polypeptide N-acetylgalactosaminyltransferase